MTLRTVYNQASVYLARVPSAAYKPICLLTIPLVVQFAYHFFRHNVYAHMRTLEHFQKDSEKMQQRAAQHQLFTAVSVIEFGVFAYLTRKNRFYWIPAGYTALHFFWTDFTKRQEKIVSHFFHSMDGDKPIVK